ncbi:MAG TPA: arsenite efflux transporter metallochaperone ArsD [Bryobacteraceae bacterium]|nr:arsenite efflux transporter metallochaperone ArsD [Bryobacteraceae bacterium]
MKKVEVFDPPMCCSTGVCGPNVDPRLVKFASDLHWLANQRVAVERYNLAQQPHAFAASEIVRAALQKYGNECLPLILLNGAIISKGCYPTRDELAHLTGVEPEQGSAEQAVAELPVINTRCCG